jgi:hypothetical protein
MGDLMLSQYLYRLIAVVPAAMQNQVNSWIAANIDPPPAGPWLTNGLSAMGVAPASHYFFDAGLTANQFAAIVAQIASTAGVTVPSNWANMAFADQSVWVSANVAAIRQANGVSLNLSDNTGIWADPVAFFSSLGLKQIGQG